MKKLLMSLMVFFLVVSVALTAFATEGDDWLGELLQGQNQNVEVNGNVEEILEGNNTTTNENLPETTPHAGMGDYSGLIFVAVFAISAVYAYKKVREYNA